MKRQRQREEQVGYVEGPKDGSYFLRYWSNEPGPDGHRTRRAVEVGRKGQFRSKEQAHASMEAATLRRRINAGILGRTVGQVIAQYERDGLPRRDNTRLTAVTCLKYCREKWETEPIAELADPTRAKVLEGWINDLRTRVPKKQAQSRDASYYVKRNVRQQMAHVFNFAMRQGFIPSQINPMKFVKVEVIEAPERKQTLTPAQIEAFFRDPEIPEHVRTIAQVAKFTGLRISEILGLRTSDFDLDKMTITVRRRMFHQKTAGPKTKKSGEAIPFPEELFELLNRWRKSKYFLETEEQWIFASLRTNGPYDANGMQQDYLHPWGKKHDIKRFGWHTFRHSYKQFLEDSGTRAEVIQRLMRHSSYQVTAGYGSGIEMETLQAGQMAAAAAMKRKLTLVKQQRRWA